MHCRTLHGFLKIQRKGQKTRKAIEYLVLTREMIIIESKTLRSSITPGWADPFQGLCKATQLRIDGNQCKIRSVTASLSPLVAWLKSSSKSVGQSCTWALGRTGCWGTGQGAEGTGQGAEGTGLTPTQVINTGFAPRGPAEEELEIREQILPLPLSGIKDILLSRPASSDKGLAAPGASQRVQLKLLMRKTTLGGS